MACLPLRGVAASGLPLQQCAQGARRIRSLFTAPAPSSSPFTAPVPSSTRVSASPAIATLPTNSGLRFRAARWSGRAAIVKRRKWDAAHCAGFKTDDSHCERPQGGSASAASHWDLWLCDAAHWEAWWELPQKVQLPGSTPGLGPSSPFPSTPRLWTHLQLMSAIIARLGLGCEPSHVACDDSHVAPWASGLGEGSRHPEIS